MPECASFDKQEEVRHTFNALQTMHHRLFKYASIRVFDF